MHVSGKKDCEDKGLECVLGVPSHSDEWGDRGGREMMLQRQTGARYKGSWDLFYR
jgi:hypothetical protein